MKTSLYDYQKLAVKKLSPLRVGALFMDMGTGKSRVMLEIITLKKSKFEHVIWFTPCSAKRNLIEEIRKHSSFSIENVSNTIKNKAFIKVCGIDSLSGSDSLYLDLMDFVDKHKCLIAVDESLFIKGWTSKRTKRAIEISKKCRYRYIMNGTPLTLGYQDLFPQLFLLSPSILGYNSFYSFAANHLEWDARYKRFTGAHNTGLLARKLEPYCFQIQKEDCLDLPPITHQYKEFVMDAGQRGEYVAAKKEILDNLQDRDLQLLALLTRLQSITAGAEYPAQAKNRITLLLETLEAVSSKSLIWVKHNNSGNEIVEKIGGIPFFGKYIKQGNIDEFRKSDSKHLVIGLAAGSFGLNLQFSSNAIFYSSSFNYGNMMQAHDRVYRAGQMNKTTMVYLLAENSIDNMIKANLSTKGAALNALRRDVRTSQGNKSKLIDIINRMEEPSEEILGH